MSEGWKIVARLDSRTGPREWISGDVRSSMPGWREQSSDGTCRIVRMTFHASGNTTLWMSGMEAYNFLAEGMYSFRTRRIVPVAFHFFGRLPGSSCVSRWTLNRKGWTHASIDAGAAPARGWKWGASAGLIISEVMRGR